MTGRSCRAPPGQVRLSDITIPIPDGVRELLDAPNDVHLSTLRADGSPRNWVVWVGLEGDRILVCTFEAVQEGSVCEGVILFCGRCTKLNQGP